MSIGDFLENLDIKEDIGTNMSADVFSKLGKAQIDSLQGTKDSLLALVGHGITDLDRIKVVMGDIDTRIDSIKHAIKLRWVKEKVKL